MDDQSFKPKYHKYQKQPFRREPTITQQEQDRRDQFSERYNPWTSFDESRRHGPAFNYRYYWQIAFPFLFVFFWFCMVFGLLYLFEIPEVQGFMHWVDKTLERTK